jgi:hypothetical protein
VAFVAMLAAACSGSQGRSAAAGVAPCKLITAQQAAAAIGSAVDLPKSQAGGCTWSAAGGKRFVAVSVRSGSQATLDATRASDRGRPEPGVGERAYVAFPGRDLSVVAFLKAHQVVSILVRAPHRRRATLLALARPAAQQVR